MNSIFFASFCVTVFLQIATVSFARQCDERAACYQMCGMFMPQVEPFPGPRPPTPRRSHYKLGTPKLGDEYLYPSSKPRWTPGMEVNEFGFSRPPKTLLPLATGKAAGDRKNEGYILIGKHPSKFGKGAGFIRGSGSGGSSGGNRKTSIPPPKVPGKPNVPPPQVPGEEETVKNKLDLS